MRNKNPSANKKLMFVMTNRKVRKPDTLFLGCLLIGDYKRPLRNGLVNCLYLFCRIDKVCRLLIGITEVTIELPKSSLREEPSWRNSQSPSSPL